MDTQQSLKLSLILSTYKEDRYLEAILEALSRQSCKNFELIVAEDADRQETKTILQSFQQKHPLKLEHVYQGDEGFRKALILNKAILKASGDYIIFLDGDCIPHPRFIEDHAALAEKGYFVQGRRCFVEEAAIDEFLKHLSLTKLFLKAKVKGILKGIRWPLAFIRKNKQLYGMLACNLAAWKEDLLAVNGFNEEFIGWGREDSDLGARLYHLGRRRKFVYGRAIVYHQNHAIRCRSLLLKNESIFEETLKTKRIRCTKGLDSHYTSRIMTTLPISLCIIAKNEEKNLQACLASIADLVSEIILVINDCTDGTAAVAKSFGAKVYEHSWLGDRDQRNLALGYASQDWILASDADEVFSEELRQSLKDFFKEDYKAYQGAYFPRLSLFLGQWIRHGDWYPDHCIRLFQRGLGITKGLARHPKVEVQGRLKLLKGNILHYTVQSLDTQLLKIPSFSQCFFEHQLSKKQKFSAINAIFRSSWRFFRGYILRLGFLDGYRGFYIAALSFFSTLHRYSRLLEHEENQRKK